MPKLDQLEVAAPKARIMGEKGKIDVTFVPLVCCLSIFKTKSYLERFLQHHGCLQTDNVLLPK